MGMALVDFTRVRSSDCSWNWFGNPGESEPVTLRWQVTTLWIPRHQILAPTGALWRYQTPLVFWLFFGQQGSHCNSHSTKTTCFDRHLLILCYNDYDFFFRKIDKFDDDEENEDCVFSFWFQSSRCANGKVRCGFALKCVSRFWLCRTCCWCWRQVQLRWWPPTDGCHYSLPSSSVLLLHIFPRLKIENNFALRLSRSK